MKKIHSFLATLILASLLLPACMSSAPDCFQEEIFCAGLVTNLDQLSDKAFNQSAWEGLQQARSDGIVNWIDYIESTDGRDYDKNIKTFANLGYDVIITVGDSMSESTSAAAAIYPDVYFIGIDQYQSWATDTDSSNDQGNLAGLMTETGKIGAVCASDIIPAMWRYGEGFRSGASYIDPGLDVQVAYHNDVSVDISFDDPEWGAGVTFGMIDGGTDIIFGVGGETGKGSIVEAATRGVYAIGADSDQYLQEPVAAPKLLSSAVKSITPAIVELLQIIQEAQRGLVAFPAGNTYGGADLAPFHDLDETVPDEVKVRLEEISLMLKNGVVQTGVPSEKP
jgi:basic membrane protein A